MQLFCQVVLFHRPVHTIVGAIGSCCASSRLIRPFMWEAMGATRSHRLRHCIHQHGRDRNVRIGTHGLECFTTTLLRAGHPFYIVECYKTSICFVSRLFVTRVHPPVLEAFEEKVFGRHVDVSTLQQGKFQKACREFCRAHQFGSKIQEFFVTNMDFSRVTKVSGF